MAVWPWEWLDHVLGGADAAARTSGRAADVAFRVHCMRHGGKDGLHLHTSLHLQLWKGELGYIAYRRAGGQRNTRSVLLAPLMRVSPRRSASETGEPAAARVS
jgi:hypothetical protein